MGVPGFVAWLYNNHANTNFIFNKLFKTSNIDDSLNDLRINSADYLFIDGNCLIHPVARKTYMDNQHLIDTNNELLENKIIMNVIAYIELIINQIKPTTLIYLAIDGVAPMAKIKHQRIRRFKSVYDKQIIENLSKKHNRPYQPEWNTSAITPGTVFMDNLTKYIISWINKTKFDSQIIFSSSYTPGEGEHKILQYIRTNTNTNININSNIIIYGLDADLLFLSLCLNRPNIYLMRETSEMELNKKAKYNKTNTTNINEDLFSYLSIDILSTMIFNITNDYIKNKLSKKEYQLDKQHIINDFVFLCYFCGNDFIPNIPSLNLKPHNYKIKNGIDTIFETYANCIIDQIEPTIKYLININSNTLNNSKQISINQDLFMIILKKLADEEIAYFTDLYNFRRNIRRSTSTDDFQIDKHNYEENIINNFKDNIQLGNPNTKLDNWKYNYYKNYYNVKIDTTNKLDNSLNSSIDEYIKGLVWTNYYYFDKCKDYEWFYTHHHGLFVSDIYNYLIRFPNSLSTYENLYTNGVWFENQIKPLHQLMLVLPLESSFLIPSSYRNLMFSYKLKKYFPNKITDIKIDYLFKNKCWQNIPMINIIPPFKIIKLTSKIILNDENDRNKLYNEYIKTK